MDQIEIKAIYRRIRVGLLMNLISLLGSLWVLMAVESQHGQLMKLFDDHVICQIGPMADGDPDGESYEILAESSSQLPSKHGSRGLKH